MPKDMPYELLVFPTATPEFSIKRDAMPIKRYGVERLTMGLEAGMKEMAALPGALVEIKRRKTLKHNKPLRWQLVQSQSGMWAWVVVNRYDKCADGKKAPKIGINGQYV